MYNSIFFTADALQNDVFQNANVWPCTELGTELGTAQGVPDAAAWPNAAQAMPDATAWPNVAQDMLRNNGFPVLLRRGGLYDFNAASATPEQVWSGHGVLAGSLAGSRAVAAFADGGLVASAGKTLLLTVDGKKDAQDRAFYPAQGDIASFGGETWRVTAVETTEPGGVPIVHTLALNKDTF